MGKEVQKMKISARNQLKGTVKNVNEGAVNGIVTLEIAGGKEITATISMSSIKELGLEAGKEAYAIIKSTEVMIADGAQKLSARNQLAGKVVGVEEGAVNGIVKVEIAPEAVISSTISMTAIKELGVAVGKDVTAVAKATSVMIGIE